MKISVQIWMKIGALNQIQHVNVLKEVMKQKERYKGFQLSYFMRPNVIY